MRLIRACVYVVLWMLTGGCSGGDVVPALPQGTGAGGAERLVVRIAPQEYIDSAQVFFFRPLAGRDTLVARRVIHGIDAVAPRPFTFDLPAGSYHVWVFGNVPTACVSATAPYSSEDVYFDYRGRVKPGIVAYGNRMVTAGTDTAVLAGMVLLSGYVGLTIREVPAGVERIIVTLGNTSAGLTLQAGYLPQAMNPPLADTLYEVRAGSTYQSAFYCFPPGGEGGVSTLGVECLGADGKRLYSGEASAWSVRPGYDYKISCSFGKGGRAGKASRSGGGIYFREDGE